MYVNGVVIDCYQLLLLCVTCTKTLTTRLMLKL